MARPVKSKSWEINGHKYVTRPPYNTIYSVHPNPANKGNGVNGMTSTKTKDKDKAQAIVEEWWRLFNKRKDGGKLFSDAFNLWLPTVIDRPVWNNNYSTVYKYLDNETDIMDQPYDEVDREYVHDLIVDLSEKKPHLKNSSLNKYTIFISSVMSKAYGKNYRFEGGLPKYHLRSAETQPYYVISSAEEKALYKALPESHREQFTLALLTGLRRNTVYNLRWEHVSFANGEGTIYIPGPNKLKGKDTRYLLDTFTTKYMKKLKKKTGDTEFVFTVQKPIAWAVWKKCLSTAGLPDKVRWHDTRHTYATRQADAKISLFVLQKQLGHTSSKTTERYINPDEESIRLSINESRRRQEARENG